MDSCKIDSAEREHIPVRRNSCILSWLECAAVQITAMKIAERNKSHQVSASVCTKGKGCSVDLACYVTCRRTGPSLGCLSHETNHRLLGRGVQLSGALAFSIQSGLLLSYACLGLSVPSSVLWLLCFSLGEMLFAHRADQCWVSLIQLFQELFPALNPTLTCLHDFPRRGLQLSVFMGVALKI